MYVSCTLSLLLLTASNFVVVQEGTWNDFDLYESIVICFVTQNVVLVQDQGVPRFL